MSTSSDDSDSPPDQVGYARPPMHTRWKPGQSGNPSGKRRKKPLDLPSQIREIFNDPVALRKGNKTSRVSSLGAAVIALRNKAIGGDVRAIKEMLNIAKQFDAWDVSDADIPREFTDEFLRRLSTTTIEEILAAYKIDDEEKLKKKQKKIR